MTTTEIYEKNVKDLQEQLQKSNIRIAELHEELENLKLLLKMMRGV